MGTANSTKSTGPTLVQGSLDHELVPPSLEAIDALSAEGIDTLVLCLTPKMRPLPGAAGFADWRLCGALSRLLISGVVTGVDREKVLLPGHPIGVDRILLLGFGDDVRKDSERKLGWMVETLDALAAKKIAIALPEPGRDLVGNAKAHFKKSLGSRFKTLFAPEL